MQEKWSLKPKGEAQIRLELLIKSGRITADTEPRAAMEMYPVFQKFKAHTFRTHLIRTKSAMETYCK